MKAGRLNKVVNSILNGNNSKRKSKTKKGGSDEAK